MIVEFGRDLELKIQPGFEVAKVLRNLCSSFQASEAQVVCESDADSVQGDFDHSNLPTRSVDVRRGHQVQTE